MGNEIMNTVTDKRIKKRCPIDTCKSEFISFELDPLPDYKSLILVCDVCGHRFKAQREEDRSEFHRMGIEFNC